MYKSSHWFLAIICFPGMEGCRRIRDNQPIEPKKAPVEGKKSQVQVGNTIIAQVKKEKQPEVEEKVKKKERTSREPGEPVRQKVISWFSLKSFSQTLGICSTARKRRKSSYWNVFGKDSFPSRGSDLMILPPCILIFDSLAGGTSRTRVVATLRNYLTWEHRAKFSSNHTFSKDNMRGHCPKVPQQNNFTDCGLYVLQYVESFFINPIKDYNIPIRHLKDWFEEIVVTKKREELSALIRNLMSKYGLDVSKVPDIKFPTIN